MLSLRAVRLLLVSKKDRGDLIWRKLGKQNVVVSEEFTTLVSEELLSETSHNARDVVLEVVLSEYEGDVVLEAEERRIRDKFSNTKE